MNPQSLRVAALVVMAGLPPLNKGVKGFGDWVFVVADLGSGPAVIRSVVDLDRDRWLVPGTTVTIDVNPVQLGQARAFTVDWASVAPIRDRVAAGDPALVDPRGARAAAVAARTAAAPPQPASTGSKRSTPCSGPVLEVASWSAACDDAISRTGATVNGKVRAVAIVSAMRMLFSDLTHDGQGRPNPQLDREMLFYWRKRAGNETVLSINIAGRSPYAVFVPDFDSPADKPATIAPWLYPWLPVVVAPSGTVDVLWDEVPPWTSISRSRALAAYEQHLSTLDPVSYPPPPQPQMLQFGTPRPVALPPAVQQQAAAFAEWLRTLPADQQPGALAAARASIDAMPPPIREAHLALWRLLGIQV
jgi:hypothetical protein